MIKEDSYMGRDRTWRVCVQEDCVKKTLEEAYEEIKGANN